MTTYADIFSKKERVEDMEIYAGSGAVNEQLARYGVKFGIYKNNEFKEQLFPFDMIPRIIDKDEFTYLEKGLKQRVVALNCFINDIYGDKHIVRDGIIPEEFIYAGSGYLPQCDGIKPPKGIYAHIAGIDLVQAKDGDWYVLEDNLRMISESRSVRGLAEVRSHIEFYHNWGPGRIDCDIPGNQIKEWQVQMLFLYERNRFLERWDPIPFQFHAGIGILNIIDSRRAEGISRKRTIGIDPCADSTRAFIIDGLILPSDPNN